MAGAEAVLPFVCDGADDEADDEADDGADEGVGADGNESVGVDSEGSADVGEFPIDCGNPFEFVFWTNGKNPCEPWKPVGAVPSKVLFSPG